MVNSSLISIEKLTGRDNWATWSFAVKAYLQHEDLYDCILKEPVSTEPNSIKKDIKAKSKLILLINPILYVHIQDAVNAKQVWENLSRAFEDSGLCRKVGLLKELINTSLDNSLSVEDYVNKIMSAAHKLRNIKFNVDDEWLGTLMLAGLPDMYKPMIMGLESSGMKISADLVKNKLLQEVKTSDTTALYTNTKIQPKNDQEKPKKGPRCSHCNKYGHLSKKCWFKKKETDNKTAFIAAFSAFTMNDSVNWYVDSSASMHMTMHRDWLCDVTAPPVQNIRIADNKVLKVESCGNVSIKVNTNNSTEAIQVKKVLYVPELKTNLLSVSKIIANGCKIQFNEVDCQIYNQNNKLVAKANLINDTYQLKSCKNEEMHAMTAKTEYDTYIWHQRMGHLNFTDISKMPKCTEGVKLSPEKENSICITCLEGKQTRQPFPSEGSRATELLGLIHSDVCGPMKNVSIGGARYFVTFIDDYSRRVHVYFIKSKGEVFEKFVEFKNRVENETNKKIKILRSDNGTEYKNNKFEAYLKNYGIWHQTSNPYTPEQNGLSERMNRTLIERAKCMIFNAELQDTFWAEAVATAAYIINRSPTRVLSDVTPHEVWTGEKPNLSHMRIFGCHAMVHIPKENRTKLVVKSRKLIFVGYSDSTKGYRFIDPATKKGIISRDVVFLEATVKRNKVFNLQEKEKEENNKEKEICTEKKENKLLNNNLIKEKKTVDLPLFEDHEESGNKNLDETNGTQLTSQILMTPLYLKMFLMKHTYLMKQLTFPSDCLHLQLYRDPKDRYKKGQTKASLSLQHFLGFESGFTLDKESNTIAIICQDVTVVLAFETRERLIAWQVKVGGQLGSSKEFLVMIGGGGSRKLPAGPARMHLQGRRFALTSGVPPRLLGLWELAHLRRYGVVEGRFCFEGGSHCGKGEGLHMLITDQAQDITDAFDMAAQGTLQRTPAASRKNTGNKTRPSTRLSDFNSTEQSIPDTASALYEENFFGEDCGGVSPYWPSDERRLYDDDVEIGARPPWTGADHVTLERCNNCLTKLGAISRSSTVALTPGNTFNPAWTMEAVPESSSDNSSNCTEYLTPRAIKKSLEACQCKEKPPERPPKPARLDQKKPPAPLPVQACSCSLNDNNYLTNNPKVGPYENYDVPKTTHTEIDPSEHYDTPKRIKKALADDLFQVTNSSAPGSLVLKKNCGCILKFASKKKQVIVECEENIPPVECPCQKVTNWANNLISLPYCKRTSEHVNTEVLTNQKSEEMALYATIDVSRKTNRQSAVSADKENTNEYPNETQFTNYQNIEPKEVDKFEGPYANYENLEFALSLEYYENAKDLLKRAGVTQNELDALSANIDLAVNSMPKKPKLCTKCGHSQTALNKQDSKKSRNDEYLLMEPTNEPKHEYCTKTLGPNPGYTPMSPNPNWSQSLKHPMHKHRVEIEKSLSIPTLTGNESRISIFGAGNNNKESLQKRSSSVDSARLLEDLKEFDSSIGSHATSSSLETLRNLAIENRRTSSPCENETECYDCCKSSGSENKTSEESCSKEIPHLRNKLMDNAQIKRSSSVPCKSGGNRDSSSSNDSGVSSCSMKHGGPDFNEFEMPLTSGHSRYHYMVHKRMRGNLTGCVHSSLPRKSKSSDPLRDLSMQLHKAAVPAKSSSAEAEVPVLPPKQFKGVMDTHSTSSGTSDMSDYIETLSMSSSHSSSDTGMRLSRQPTNTLRPRSGKEYHNIDPIITSMYKNGKDLANYTNIP